MLHRGVSLISYEYDTAYGVICGNADCRTMFGKALKLTRTPPFARRVEILDDVRPHSIACLTARAPLDRNPSLHFYKLELYSFYGLSSVILF